MRTSKIKTLIKLVEESNVDELEVSIWGRRVRIRKNLKWNDGNNGNKPQVDAVVPDRITEKVSEQPAEARVQVELPKKKENLLEIKTPMVGTFYRAPAPDAKPYVQVGDRISRGQIICIIEAMKIMNEIESEYDGTIVEILAQNTQPVQYGQTMFTLEPVS
jgi:acetyl-CoA carboxylase biotin carboxyl carrier protein